MKDLDWLAPPLNKRSAFGRKGLVGKRVKLLKHRDKTAGICLKQYKGGRLKVKFDDGETDNGYLDEEFEVIE